MCTVPVPKSATCLILSNDLTGGQAFPYYAVALPIMCTVPVPKSANCLILSNDLTGGQAFAYSVL